MSSSNTSVPFRGSVTCAQGAGGLRDRPSRLTARSVRASFAAVLLVLAGCASPGVDGSIAEPTTPTTTALPTSSAPSPTETVSAEVEVVAAYEQYLEATAEAMKTGDGELEALLDAAEGQALAAAQARVVALASQERTARGRLVPSVEEVRVQGDTATVRDCYRADITEHEQSTGEQVADRGGARLSATAQLKQDGGAWVVASFKEGDSCVPSELAAEIEDQYLAFWATVAEAGAPPDPQHQGLGDVAAGDQLEGLRSRLRDFEQQGYEIRDDSVANPRVVQVSHRDTVAHVRDCRELDPDGGVYDADSGELIDGGARDGQHALWVVRLELIDGVWKVVDADLAEEDSKCAADS